MSEQNSNENQTSTKSNLDVASNETMVDPLVLRRDNEEYKIVKKLPKRFPTSKQDVYITNKTDFKVQLEKCKKMLLNQNVKRESSGTPKEAEFTKRNQVVLHAMGPAINRFF